MSLTINDIVEANRLDATSLSRHRQKLVSIGCWIHAAAIAIACVIWLCRYPPPTSAKDLVGAVLAVVLGPAVLLFYPPIALVILTPAVILITVGKQHPSKLGFAVAGFCITAAWWIFIASTMLQFG